MTSTAASRQLGAGLARAQLASISWATLGAGNRTAEHVRDHLMTTMLFSEDSRAVEEAYTWIENPVTAQGDLSECAPAVVSVIMAAVADDSVPYPNLGPVLDLLGLTLAGYTATWELERGVRGLRAACYREAMKGYWSLRSIATLPTDRGDVSGEARTIVEMLDDEALSPEPDRTEDLCPSAPGPDLV
jgi:hypothetical protein